MTNRTTKSREQSSRRPFQTAHFFGLLAAAALTSLLMPAAHAQWDRDGYFTGEAEPEEPGSERPRRERRSAPSDSYDFRVNRGGNRDTGVADVSYFYEALDDGGVWMNHPRYGDVWQPYVDENWRPYTLGRWAYSDDYGWTWVSDEPFGWAVYHYGRWSYDRDYGWLWVPGTEWAPAWVAWRQSEEAIGWAPLPPDTGDRGGEIFDGERFNRAWVFVRPRYFARPEMRRYVRPHSWNSDLVHRTAPHNTAEHSNNKVRNRGIAPDEVERLSNRPVPRIRVAPVDDPGLRRPDRIQGRFDNWRERSKGEVKIFRPERRRTEEAVRKFRRSQPGSSSDGARENGAGAAAPIPRPARRIAKPAPPGTHPGGKPAIAAVRPPRFDGGPAQANSPATSPQTKRDAARPEPSPVITPPADTPPPASSAPAHKSAAPAYVPSRAPASGDSASAPPAEPKIINPSPPPGEPPRTAGKRRWDGSGPSGAPTSGPEGPAEN